MARTMHAAQTALYRTVRRAQGGDGSWREAGVYGPYVDKGVNRDYDFRYRPWRSEDRDEMGKGTLIVEKQELRPVLHLTPDNGLVLGLEWVTYERNGKKIHVH